MLHEKVDYYLQFDGYPHQTVSRTYYQDHITITIKDVSDTNSKLIKESRVYKPEHQNHRVRKYRNSDSLFQILSNT